MYCCHVRSMDRTPVASALLAILVTLTIAAPAGAQVDAELVFNQKFLGIISQVDDVDEVEIEEVAGSKLTITVTADAGNSMKPGLEIDGPSGASLNLTGVLKESGKTAKVKKLVLAESGTYTLRVRARNGLTGTYKVKVLGQPPTKTTGLETVTAPAEVLELPFVSRAGGRLSGHVTRATGTFVPYLIELVGPGGVLVQTSGSTSYDEEGGVLSLDGIDLPTLGDYRVRVTGKSGTTGSFAWKLKVKVPNAVTGKIYEDGHPKFVPNPDDGFTLTEMRYGRGLPSEDLLGVDVVSPLSLVKSDPVSGLPIPGTLTPLFEGGNLEALTAFNLGPLFQSPVLPRNAVIVLEFTQEPSLESLQLDDDGMLTPASPVQVVFAASAVPLRATLDGTRLILDPVVADEVGFPPSPLAFTPEGVPVASSDGVAKLSIVSTGPLALASGSGATYTPRADLIGSPDVGGEPLGFNPGNSALDFFEQIDLGAGQSYGGFLPDEDAPRIIREVAFEEQFSPDIANPELGDNQGAAFISFVSAVKFDIDSKGGLGEWAGGLLRLRAGGENEELRLIERNTVMSLPGGQFRNDIHLTTTIGIPLGDGDGYELARAEFFEPDPLDPIDPVTFDSDNPLLSDNAVLANFVEVHDRLGVPITDLSVPIDAFSTFTFRFSEPMQRESFGAYESFYISDPLNEDEYYLVDLFGRGVNFVGAIESSNAGRSITFRPGREIQFGPQKGTVRPVPLSVESRELVLHLKVRPPDDVLEGLIGSQKFEQFERLGHRGVTDLGGRPLGFPLTALADDRRVVDYRLTFTTAAEPTQAEVGAIVQRFLGRPETGFDAFGSKGIKFADVPENLTGLAANIYGPRIADLNLFSDGFLSGAPVQFISKIHDDFNPPFDKDGAATQMNPFPFGTSTPIGGFSVLGGVRMQHTFRAVEASPDWEALAGTNLDLIDLAYAPIGGFVTDTILPDISIHAGHTSVVPDTHQNQGIPTFPNSGLAAIMDNNYDAVELSGGVAHSRQLVYGTDNGGGSFTGGEFKISNSSRFTPVGTQHAYHPLPHEPFQQAFAYNNGSPDVATFGGGNPTWGGNNGDNKPESLLLEYRVRVVDPVNPPSMANGFTFAVGVLSSAVPRFRVFTIGVGCMACCIGGCGATCIIQYGPALDGLPLGTTPFSGGGPPLDPDGIVLAAGPAPAPPGLPCRCLNPPQNPAPIPGGCVPQNPGQSIDVVSAGTTLPNGINFGDNSRYFMIFNYAKRESRVRSPFIEVGPGIGTNPRFLDPIFDPPLDAIPGGTKLTVKFRASASGSPAGIDATAWVSPEQLSAPGSAVNAAFGTRFLQFEADFEGNTSTSLTPILDSLVVPFVDG